MLSILVVQLSPSQISVPLQVLCSRISWLVKFQRLPAFDLLLSIKCVSLGAMSTHTSLASSVADMEALACLRVVQFAAERELQQVIIEGDSVIIIAAITQGRSLLSSFGNTVDDVLCLLPKFSSIQFNHVNHSGNLVADALAKKVASIVGCHVWPDALPLDIVALVDFDVH